MLITIYYTNLAASDLAVKFNELIKKQEEKGRNYIGHDILLEYEEASNTITDYGTYAVVQSTQITKYYTLIVMFNDNTSMVHVGTDLASGDDLSMAMVKSVYDSIPVADATAKKLTKEDVIKIKRELKKSSWYDKDYSDPSADLAKFFAERKKD